jgi:hypothetical protein
MDRTRLGRLSVRAAIVIAAVGLVASARPLPTGRVAALAELQPRHRPSELPPPLQASLVREDITLVSAIAADIDADGDLDVVGSDDQLELVILVNDGRNNLSRRPSRQPGQWSTAPAPPSLHERPDGSAASVQNDPPSTAPDRRSIIANFDRGSIASPAAGRFIAAGARSSASPRAPPAALRG